MNDHSSQSSRIQLVIPFGHQMQPFCPCLSNYFNQKFKIANETLLPLFDTEYEWELAKNLSKYIQNYIEQCDENDPKIIDFLQRIESAFLNPFNNVDKCGCNEVGICKFWKVLLKNILQ